MAGFGGGAKTSGGKKNKKNKKSKGAAPLVLKPKQQWDRYASLKASKAFKVAVRVINDDAEDSSVGEWFETGKVKSESDESTETAVVMQRGIIAEVCSVYVIILDWDGLQNIESNQFEFT